MRITNIPVFIVAIAVSTVAHTQSAEPGWMVSAKLLVQQELKDPEAAKFSNVRLIDGGIICGKVNAKNSYGGYTGFQSFAVMPALGTVKASALVGDGPNGQVAAAMCEKS